MDKTCIFIILSQMHPDIFDDCGDALERMVCAP